MPTEEREEGEERYKGTKQEDEERRDIPRQKAVGSEWHSRWRSAMDSLHSS